MPKTSHNQVAEAQLKLPDGTLLKLPVYRGTLGPDVIDIRELGQAGYFTYDPGFMATASCASKLTFIDGAKGRLMHGGYAIDDLARDCTFLQVAHLLLYGELPKQAEERNFVKLIKNHTMVSENVQELLRAFDSNAHPMAVLITLIGALAGFYHETTDISDRASRDDAARRLIAKVPTLAAMSYKFSIGQPIIYPQNTLGFVENFLYMMFATPCEPYRVDPKIANALEAILVLHADHEQNASTSTVRLAGSTNANPFACISAGVASLWGPAHGGANEAVLRMLDDIGTAENIPAYLKGIVDGTSGKRLMGFGHRVYKSYDPRAQVMRKICHDVLKHLKLQGDSVFEIAIELERIALADEYYVKRNLYPNVDFYSGIVLRAIGIPAQMFTAVFAIARTVGWVAQWRELHEDPEFRIGRPRQLYEGPRARKIKPAGRSSSK